MLKLSLIKYINIQVILGMSNNIIQGVSLRYFAMQLIKLYN